MREQAMVLVRTMTHDEPGEGCEKETITQGVRQGNHRDGMLGTCDVGSLA